MAKKVFTFFSFFYVIVLVGQNDTISYRLDEVIINATKKLKENSIGQHVVSLSDSVLTRNIESFTDLIRYNSSIYLKEYGKGGTSSVSFRGTSASNTAVVWNGININSINNGQTGFNSLTVSLNDAIDVRKGGGSIEFGSGAIGGTVHLNDVLNYTEDFNVKNQFVLTGGSYNTFNSLFKSKISNSKYSIGVGVSRNSSENDFKLFNSEYRNTNGVYENYGINLGFGYKFNNQSELKFYSTSFSGERHFSGTLPNPTSAREKYIDSNQRNLLVYGFEKGKLEQEVKLAYLTQKYQYFSNKFSDNFNYGKSRRVIASYNLNYKLPRIKAKISFFSEYESAFGSTDVIKEKNRKQFSQHLVYTQDIHKNVSFNVKLRKDFNSDYKVPFVYAAGIKVTPISKWYVRVNGSKNYRVPTYNDLFWPGQGNENLIPETSIQGEVGLGYSNKGLNFDMGAYMINTEDKIVWTPSGDPNRPGVWTPINLNETQNKGIEASLSYKVQIGEYKFNASSNYSYVLAKDSETDKYLTFVPKHLLNSNLSVNYKKVNLFTQSLFNGAVYTTEDNSNDLIVPSFFIVNVGTEYEILQTQKKQLLLGIKVNNVLGEKYMVMPRRPMPQRNFNININYKF
ncbi:TonB-dependent receptor domain-containing protein [Tenacibaculum aestuarii]|uniref:TonB-dependent receptor domain-containing protein n=1 Tax=Tenacibaculum aestuarii TaxID=362781 RepID=UPI003895DCD9